MSVIFVLVISGLSFLGSLAGGYLRGYTTEKGKNLATAEDIGKITSAVESIKADFASAAARAEGERLALVEQFRAVQSTRTIAGIERLKALQQAFTQWQRLATTDTLDDEYWRTCSAWWYENCLFLDEKPRMAFINAVAAFGARRKMKMDSSFQNDFGAQAMVNQGESIRDAGKTIMAAAGLTALSDDAASLVLN